MHEFVYLASPYTHPDEKVRAGRYLAACAAAARLMREGRVVFSPIAHSHSVELYFDAPENGAFWERQDRPFLELCSGMVVLRLQGWEQSKGVAHEIARAHERGIPVEYIDP